MMLPGIFIALEGPEGAGKTTQRENLAKYFTERGHDVVLTREPGGTPLAERIREVLLTPTDEIFAKKTELALFYAARVQHVETVIKPALARGAIVLCDRFVDSSYAYQMAGRQLERSVLDDLHNWALGDFKPDLTILFEISPEIGLRRAAARGRLDRMEQEGIDFFERVMLGYLAQYQREPWRYALINADAPIHEVWYSIEAEISKFLDMRRTSQEIKKYTDAE